MVSQLQLSPHSDLGQVRSRVMGRVYTQRHVCSEQYVMCSVVRRVGARHNTTYKCPNQSIGTSHCEKRRPLYTWVICIWPLARMTFRHICIYYSYECDVARFRAVRQVRRGTARNYPEIRHANRRRSRC